MMQDETKPSAAADTAADSAAADTAAAEPATAERADAGAADASAAPESESDKKSNKKWYIIHTHSTFEDKVVDSIQERARTRSLDSHIGELNVPVEEVVEVRRGQRTQVKRKLFPGYVFANMAMTDEVYHLIKDTPKVTGFLGAQKQPVAIPDSDVMQMLNKARADAENPKMSVMFEVGEQVRVSDGPFASFDGLVEEIDAEKARLKVAVSIFGRPTPVELEYSQVEKV